MIHRWQYDYEKDKLWVQWDDSLDTLDINDFEDVLKGYLIHSFYKYILGHIMCQVQEQDITYALRNVSVLSRRREKQTGNTSMGW